MVDFLRTLGHRVERVTSEPELEFTLSYTGMELFCGFAVISGSHYALPLGRVAQIAAAIAVAALIPLGLVTGSVWGLVLVAGFCVALWLWLIGAYNALARVPLRKENRAGRHRLG